MEQLALLLDQWGYVLLFAVGFLEFAGAPIASVPVLVIAGALASSGEASLASIIGSAALGGLLGDLTWYGLARWRGPGLVDIVCGLSSNPMACVLGVERRVQAVGPGFLLPAKFLPGAGNLVAAASGFAGIRLGTFALLDLIALVIWAGVYASLGWMFAPQLEPILEWASAFTLWIAGLAVVLIVGAGAWRIAKVRMHRERHEAMRAQSGDAGG
ncbi:MAG: DedA family protein [Gemmatimonadales bacterium]|jgi:membrane protein DedA with SNARE-associated domain